jgi:hypothetical protein
MENLKTKYHNGGVCLQEANIKMIRRFVDGTSRNWLRTGFNLRLMRIMVMSLLNLKDQAYPSLAKRSTALNKGSAPCSLLKCYTTPTNIPVRTSDTFVLSSVTCLCKQMQTECVALHWLITHVSRQITTVVFPTVIFCIWPVTLIICLRIPRSPSKLKPA